MKLSFAWNGEWLQFFVKFHLPESGSEVQHGEDSGVSLSNVAYALFDFLHGIFVNEGVLVHIRKDCFQVKSNLLTYFRFTTHMNIMILN